MGPHARHGRGPLDARRSRFGRHPGGYRQPAARDAGDAAVPLMTALAAACNAAQISNKGVAAFQAGHPGSSGGFP
nr:hypothetical protein SHINE37_42819 [Rhizobiaceae bacterium]